MKKKLVTKSNKKEIFWNIVNSGMAGALVLLGSMTTGSVTIQSMTAAMMAALIIAVSQFKDYWNDEKREYCNNKLGCFIR